MSEMRGRNEKIERLLAEVKKAIKGKDDAIVSVITAMLAGGHILLEDIPNQDGLSIGRGAYIAISCLQRKSTGPRPKPSLPCWRSWRRDEQRWMV